MIGTVYLDGSWLDGLGPYARGGWAFVVLDDDGKIVAAAYGVPPPWIKDIGGAEAWVVLQVGLRAMPGKVKYMIDCQPCVDMVHGGVVAATTADRPLARVNGMVMSTLEDTSTDKVVWMPAHKSKKAAGILLCSNGVAITELNIKGNAEADRLAKLAVMQHRMDPAEVRYWDMMCGNAWHGNVDCQGHVGGQQLRGRTVQGLRGKQMESRSAQQGNSWHESEHGARLVD